MFDISNNGIITLNRGDSFTLTTSINLGTVLEPIQYVLDTYDSVYFALMEPNQPFECALMRREFNYTDLDANNDVVMKFNNEQTEYLLPGTYYYMIKLVRRGLLESGQEEPDIISVDTIVPKTKFVIVD